MPPALPATNLTTLLEHSVWVRRLATTLVGDQALAEDLTQEAFLSALRHPPADGLPVRPWLGQVVRNLARMRFRGERRRRGREEATLQEPAPPGATGEDSPEQLVVRAQTQRALAALVLALEEPYRSTILLRYYEGLSAADIAVRQAIPPGTVRWRLKTGIDRLRAELDRSHGGERRAWLPLLAPLASQPAGPGGTESISTVSQTKGVLIMKPLIPLFVLLTGAVTGVVVTRPKTPPPSLASVSAPAKPLAVAGPSVPVLPARLNKQQRSLLLQQLQQAQPHANRPLGPGLPAAPTAEVPTLDHAYIRTQIQALMPLLKECYETALGRVPSIAGKLVVQFTIAATPDLGGLVTDSSIDSALSTITDAGMQECVQETMYAAHFAAPTGGGEVHVTYPFVFAPAE